MAIDWDEFEGELEKIIEEGVEQTDEQLASKISSLTRMTDKEIQELFPEPGDVKALAELMAVVKSAEDHNTKINKIVENSEKFAGIVLTLVDKFV